MGKLSRLTVLSWVYSRTSVTLHTDELCLAGVNEWRHSRVWEGGTCMYGRVYVVPFQRKIVWFISNYGFIISIFFTKTVRTIPETWRTYLHNPNDTSYQNRPLLVRLSSQHTPLTELLLRTRCPFIQFLVSPLSSRRDPTLFPSQE